MEVYFAATGPLHWLHQFENQLEAQSFSIPYTDPIGRQMNEMTGGLLEPIQLYRFIVPKDAMPLVLRTLSVGAPSTAKAAISGVPIFALRKLMGLKEVPTDPTGTNYMVGPRLAVNTQHVQIVPIGIKEDNVRMIAPTGVVQEDI